MLLQLRTYGDNRTRLRQYFFLLFHPCHVFCKRYFIPKNMTARVLLFCRKLSAVTHSISSPLTFFTFLTCSRIVLFFKDILLKTKYFAQVDFLFFKIDQKGLLKKKVSVKFISFGQWQYYIYI